MTREELIEKVARALCWKNGQNPNLTLGGDGENFLWMEYEYKAEVAIDIVLEEAARAAAIASLGCSQDAADRIQRAIRALKES